MTVAVVIPAYNEAKYLAQVVNGARSFVDYVIVVDDGSTDETPDIIRQLSANQLTKKVIALYHEVNLGKGAALKTGCEAAIYLKADIIITMDADNQHNPKIIPNFIAALQRERVDIVFGARQFNSRMPWSMILGNYFLSRIINRLFKMMVHDTQSGFRAFTIAAYRAMQWESRGYEAETEMIVRASEHQLRYQEIDIDTIYHDNYKGTTFLDGIRIFWHIMRWKFI